MKGRIADQQAVSRIASLRRCARWKPRAGVSIESAVVGMGGPTVRGANGRGVLELGYVREIEQRDVNRVVDRASRVQLQEDRMVLQLFPQDFVVDDHPGHRDPRKMLASRLEVNVHLVTASMQEHNALVGAVNQAHLTVEETVFEALAACYAAVLPEDAARRHRGGRYRRALHRTGHLLRRRHAPGLHRPHLRRSLHARSGAGLCLSFEDAEMRQDGIRLRGLAESARRTSWWNCPRRKTGSRAKRSAASSTTFWKRAPTKLFRFVRGEFARVGMDRALIGGVFLTGAGARLPGLCDVAEEVLQCQTRFGLTDGIQDWPAELNDPEWCTAAGLAMYSAKLKATGRAAKGTRKLDWARF